mmetsp:Transcript_2392/g.2662  ORF Transcript_2392/g.2662 Transcript_2392/m.2662 type:complete len:184 (-) Transcript_2392:25-576(-)
MGAMNFNILSKMNSDKIFDINKRRKLNKGDMTELDYNMDTLLNLEEEYYRQGYQEGQDFSTKQQYNEGKEYGYQTGFQRFLVIGYIQGLLNHWKENIEQYEKGVENKSLRNHISQLNELVQNIPTTNGIDEVKEFEKRITKSRNKLRVIANICKELWKVNKIDNLMKEIGGQLQVSENVDDMW